ncbi:MAG: Ig-like domain-containing protein, partial [Clostridia bacterium]
MRKTNKVVALLLTLVFLLSAIIPVGAAILPADVTKAAVGLADYGIVDTPGTTTDTLTRGQFAKIASLAGGKTAADYTTAQAKASIYKDIKTADWYNGWSQLAPFQGIDAAPNFAPKALIKRVEVLRILVRQMGIVDVTDNAAFMAQARALGLTDAADADANGAVTRGEAFVIVAKALDANLGARFFPGKAPILAPLALQVTSITALNAKQVQVVFNKAVDKTAAELIGNYDVFLLGTGSDVAGSASLQADGKTVIVELSAGNKFANYSTTNKVVVKAAVGLVADATNAAVVYNDSTLPALVSATATGSNEITLTFTEPVISSGNATNVVVNDNTVGINLAATYSVAGKTMTFKTYASMVAGTTYTVKISSGTNILDYAGYAVIPASASFVYAPVTVAPTYVVKSSTEKSATIEFTSAVTGLAGNADVAFSHTYAGANKVTGAAVTAIDSKTYRIDFVNPFAPGTSTMFAAYTVGLADSSKIKDAFGNIVTLVNSTITTVADVTAPTATVAMASGSNTDIAVTFSEAVTGGSTVGNYVLKQGTTVKTITSAIVDTDNSNKYNLTVPTMSGAYTLTISNIKDTSIAQNAMATTTYNLTVADLIRPTVVLADGVTVDNHYYYLSTATKVRIYFSEAMDMASISDLTKYQVGTTNPTSATPAADGKSVLLVFAAAPESSIILGTVKDAAGNLLAGLSATLTSLAAPKVGLNLDTVAVPNNVVADTTTSVKVYLNDIVSGLVLTDLLVTTNGSTYFSPATFTVDNASGKSVVRLILASAFAESATNVAISSAAVTAGTNADGATISVAKAAVDKIAPTVNKVEYLSSTSI